LELVPITEFKNAQSFLNVIPDHYPIQDALEACEIRGLTPERIFILARMGSTRQVSFFSSCTLLL
jgi:hypothetical protein